MLRYILHFIFYCVNGVCPHVDEQEMARAFFGAGNSINRQLVSCSNKQAVLVPGKSFKYSFTGLKPTSSEVVSEGLKILRKKYPVLSEIRHHTLSVVPESELSSDFIAYAGLGGTGIVVGDDLEVSMSIFMHEFGHNLGLGHSGIGIKEYGDTTGYMGYSSGKKGFPLRCYNAYNLYYLGWYSPNVRELTVPDRKPYRINSFVNVLGNEPALYKYKDLYFLYNQATGHNVDTGMYKDNIVFVVPERSDPISDTFLVGAINSTNRIFSYKGATFELISKDISKRDHTLVFRFSESKKHASNETEIAEAVFEEDESFARTYREIIKDFEISYW